MKNAKESSRGSTEVLEVKKSLLGLVEDTQGRQSKLVWVVIAIAYALILGSIGFLIWVRKRESPCVYSFFN